MALVFVVPTNGELYTTSNATSYATGDIGVPGAVRSYAVFIASVSTAAPAEPAANLGLGLTWTSRETVLFDTIAVPGRRLTMFTARGTATTGPITADYGIITQQGCVIVVVEIDGADTGPHASGIEAPLSNRADSGTSKAVGLGGFINANSGVIFGLVDDTNALPSPEAGYTQLSRASHGGPNTAGLVMSLSSNESNPTATGANVAWAAIAAEVFGLSVTEVTPTTIPVPFDITNPSISTGVTVSPSTIAVPFSITDPTPQTGSSPTPAAIAVPFTITDPTPQAGASPAPSVIAVPVSITDPSVATGSTAAPSTVDVPISITDPSISTGSTAAPVTIDVPVSITDPSISTGSSVSPSTVAIPFTITDPTITTEGNATASPATIAVPCTITDPAISTASSPAPSTITVPFTITDPTVETGGNATAAPATIAMLFAITDPSVSSSIAIIPTTIAVSFTLAASTVQTSITLDIRRCDVAAATDRSCDTAAATDRSCSVLAGSSRSCTTETGSSRSCAVVGAPGDRRCDPVTGESEGTDATVTPGTIGVGV